MVSLNIFTHRPRTPPCPWVEGAELFLTTLPASVHTAPCARDASSPARSHQPSHTLPSGGLLQEPWRRKQRSHQSPRGHTTAVTYWHQEKEHAGARSLGSLARIFTGQHFEKKSQPCLKSEISPKLESLSTSTEPLRENHGLLHAPGNFRRLMTTRHTWRHVSPYSPAMQLLPQCFLMAAVSHFSCGGACVVPSNKQTAVNKMLYWEHWTLTTKRAAKHKTRNKEEKKNSLKVGRKVIIMKSQKRQRKSLKAREKGKLL